MSALEIHGADVADLDEIAVPASADGDEFTAPPGSVILVAVNKLKRRSRTIGFRVERHGGTDEMTYSIGAAQTSMFGPFGMAYGEGGFEAPGGEPVTVRLTYPRADGLEVAAVAVPEPGTVIRHSSPGIGPLPHELQP